MIGAVLGWMLFGLIVGAVARLLVPGKQRMGMLKTMLIGIVGSFLGGFVGYIIVGGSPLQAAGWIGSIIGAVVAVIFATRNDRKLVSH